LGELAAALGDERRGALFYELLEPYRDLFMIHDLLRLNTGSVAGVLGKLASLLGHDEAAAGHFERAIASTTAIGAPIRTLVSKASYALFLLSRRGPGDQARGEALVEAVRSGCRSFRVPDNRRLRYELRKIAALDRNP
jgi:hypothetical protein